MKDEGYPPSARLKLRREYGYLLKRQQKAVGRHVVLLAAPRRQALRPRLGIMVSRKVSKSSPRRHQLKRWVRELFRRELQQQLPAVDLVVLFRRDLPRHGHALLDKEIRRLVEPALSAKATWGRDQDSRRRRR
ncbi:MAG: ribonuclease P protein component [Planctomycetota bacterium]